MKPVLLAMSIALAVPALGCAATVSSEPVSADVAGTRAPVAVATHGPVKLFADALGDVPLADAQRAQIEQLAAAADARHAPERAARKDFAMMLADQVEHGAIDRPALEPKVSALAAAVQTLQGPDRAAFEQLHAVLTPGQRVAFVDAVAAQIQQRAGQMRSKKPLEQWAADLALSDDQKGAIRSALAEKFHGGHHEHGGDWADAKHHGDAVMEAFKQDRFVLAEVSPPKDPAAHVSWGTDHVLGLAEVVVPLLTPAQRIVAARKLREHAEAGEDLP